MSLDVDLKSAIPFLVGLAGSFVGLKFVPGATWAERGFNVTCGAMGAGFMGPALADWAHITSAKVQYGFAFMIGVFGLSLAAAIVQGIRDVKLGEIITRWISPKG